jgi:regulator of nucleoside diphosphate kinase
MTTTTRTRRTSAAAESFRPPLTITDRDRALLERCITRALHARAHAEAEELEAELARAHIVDVARVPADVVTLNTTLVVVDADTNTRRIITVVLPEQADVERGRVSVLAPIGAAVIGLRLGDEIDWMLPNGRAARLRVGEIILQPEAVRDAGR